MSLFDLLTTLDEHLVYRRDDPNDPRLGDVLQQDRVAYDRAAVVLIGCPQDEGVRRNRGRIGAAQAPDAIRQALYRLVAQPELPTLFDLGNTRLADSLEATHERHATIIRQLIQDGKIVISLGGGNDVAYPDCKGLAQASADVLAINVDAHFDVRADTVCNSGTPYRQLLEEAWLQPRKFFEVGSLAAVNAPIYRDYLIEKGAEIIDLPTLHRRGLQAVFGHILQTPAQAIFWGLDMDVVRAADAPGVSAINPIGMDGAMFSKLGSIAGSDKRSRLFEITEVNPTYDIDDRTAKLAAMTVYQFLSHIVF